MWHNTNATINHIYNVVAWRTSKYTAIANINKKQKQIYIYIYIYIYTRQVVNTHNVGTCGGEGFTWTDQEG